MSIRFKVLISMLVVFLTVTLFLGGFMYKRFDDVLINQVKSDIDGVMLENKDNLDRIVMGIGRSFAAVGFNDFIVDALQDSDHSPETDSKNRLLIMNEYKSVFDLSLSSYVNGYVLHFYINKERELADSFRNTSHKTFQNTDFGMYSTENIEGEAWHRETVESNAPWYVFRVEENPEYIFFSKAIYVQNINTGSPEDYLGVGVVGISCSELLTEMNRRTVTENTSIAILDNENQVVTKSPDSIPDSFVRDIANENELGFNMTDQLETKDYVINRAKSNAGITFISFTTKDSIYLQTKDVRTIVIFAIVAALLAAFLLIYILSYYVTRPIKRLSRHVQQISYDNLAASRIESGSKDEVGEVYRALNTMIEKIEESIERENEQNEKARKLEIQMLQAQINPHFLYNVLDSISWLAMENEQDEIGEMADLLSQIFAYSIKDGRITAELSEELESVKKYVFLQKNRYTEDIRLEIEADEACLNVAVPKCILQPLVENSIVHGLVDDANGIHIKITAVKKEAFIEICVEDDGKGCDIGELNQILRGGDNFKFHMGIRNVARRISESYGSECGLSYRKNEKGGITARILLNADMER